MTYICAYCGVSMHTKFQLIKHMESENRKSQIPKKCCTECGAVLHLYSDLRKHLSFSHGITIPLIYKRFSNDNNFKAWLKAEEKKTQCEFRLNRDGLFVCHRSGFYMPKILSKTSASKNAEGEKIDGTCPATIKYYRTGTGQRRAQYAARHLGHPSKNQVEQRSDLNTKKDENDDITVTEKPREEAAPQNVPVNQNTGRYVMSNTKPRSPQLPIIIPGALTKEEAISIDSWVKTEVKKDSAKSCILFYKAQGRDHALLNTCDFVLIMQMPMQRYILKLFGHDRIFMEATHKIADCGLKMVTLLVVSDEDVAFPVACCFCTQDNLQTMTLFIEKIKDSCGPIKCKVFVSSVEPAYKLAWTKVMGNVDNSVLCPWSVEKALCENLNTIRDLEKRKGIEETLKALLLYTDWDTFNSKFENLLLQLLDDDETQKFGNYILTNFSSRRKEWSKAYCQKMNIKSYVNIDNFHNYLNSTVNDGRDCKRVDSVIHLIIRYVENRFKDKDGKGVTKLSDRMISRHCAGMTISDLVTQTSATSCFVRSRKDPKKLFHVQSTAHFSTCTPSCLLFCAECKICYKAMTCSCEDYKLFNVCEHIHAVMLLNNRNISVPKTENENSEGEEQTIQMETVVKASTSSTDDEAAPAQAASKPFILVKPGSTTTIYPKKWPTNVSISDDTAMRHKEGLDTSNMVVQMTESSCLVQSQEEPELLYSVQATAHYGSCTNCLLVCRECDVCYRAMTCTCKDYEDLKNICKHIHAVMSRNNVENAAAAAAAAETPVIQPELEIEKDKDKSYDTALRHKAGTDTSKMTVLQVTDNSCLVRSNQEPAKLYTVQSTEHYDLCNEDCKHKCTDCRICYDAVTCSCDDYKVRTNICEHIHAMMHLNGKESVSQSGDELDDEQTTIATIEPSVSGQQTRLIADKSAVSPSTSRQLVMKKVIPSPGQTVGAKTFSSLLKINNPRRMVPISKLPDMLERHKAGMEMSHNVEQVTGTSCLVRSRIDATRLYSVQSTHHYSYCNETCKLVCKDCKICYKAMTCSCEDYIRHLNICEHIHAVMYLNNVTVVESAGRDSSTQEVETPLQETPMRSQQETPMRLQQETPMRLQQETPMRLQQETPMRLQQETPMRLQQVTPMRLQQVTPLRLQQETPMRLQQITPMRLQPETPMRLQKETPMPLRMQPGIPQSVLPSVVVTKNRSSYDNVLRHIAGCDITDVRLTLCTYEVRSKRDPGKVFTVATTPHFSQCNASCKKVCSDCNICYRAVVCACSDYKVHLNICEHIHAIMNHMNKNYGMSDLKEDAKSVVTSDSSLNEPSPTDAAMDMPHINVYEQVNELAVKLNNLKDSLNTSSTVKNSSNRNQQLRISQTTISNGQIPMKGINLISLNPGLSSALNHWEPPAKVPRKEIKVTMNREASQSTGVDQNTTGESAEVPCSSSILNFEKKSEIEDASDTEDFMMEDETAAEEGYEYECGFCGKLFLSLETLYDHLRHIDQCPFSDIETAPSGSHKSHECHHCGKMFRQKAHLISHMLTHYDLKAYKCTQCGKAFARKSNLDVHVQIHSEIRSHGCSRCGKMFKFKSYLARHMLIHADIKSHECRHCGKMFRRNTHLTSHMFIHSGLKSYKCAQCGKGFAWKSNLTAHVQTHSDIRSKSKIARM